MHSSGLNRYVFVICGKTLLLITAVSLIIGCKEKGPIIDFGGKKSKDTTYITSVETAQQKNVLIEEFTGASCPPCPGGHETVRSIKLQYPGRIVVIAYHVLNFPQSEPVHGLSKYDFRTEDATNVGNSIYGGISALPNAGIDRVAIGNSLLLGKSEWPAKATERINVSTNVNLHLESAFDAPSREATIKIKIAYLRSVSLKQNLTIAIIQDSIIDAQKDGLSIDTFYTHNYVLRSMITQFYGVSILDSIKTKEPGRTLEKTLTYKINDAWDPKKCEIIAFITNNDATNKEVEQAISIKVTPP